MKNSKLVKIKVVSFDAFDTLFNAKNFHVEASKIILQKLNATWIDVNEFHEKWDLLIMNQWEQLSGDECNFKTQDIFFLEVIDRLFCEYNLSGDSKEALKIWFDLLEGIELFEEVPTVLKSIKEKGYSIIILSNIDNEFLYKKLADFNIETYFDQIFTSENLKSYKPNPHIFNKVLETMQINPDQIIHVGDSQHADIYGAKNFGIMAVYINRKNRALKKSIPTPDFMIKNLNELLTIL